LYSAATTIFGLKFTFHHSVLFPQCIFPGEKLLGQVSECFKVLDTYLAEHLFVRHLHTHL
jgi:hypothetical protein